MGLGFLTEQTRDRLLSDVDMLKQRVGGGGGAGDDRPRLLDIGDFGIRFYNDDSITIPGYSLIRATGGTTWNEIPIPKCKRPDTTFGTDYFINGPDAVEAGQTGIAQPGPIVKFVYSGSTPTAYTTYGPKPSQFGAELGYPALLRAIGASDTTNKFAYGLLLSPIVTLLGHAITDLAASTSYSTTSDYKIYTGTTGSESDSGFTTLPSIYMRVAVAKGKKFTIEWINNGWQVNAAAPYVAIGKTDSSVAAGASGTVSIWTGTPGSESDSGDNITGVRNRTSVDIPTTKWVRVEYINGNPYMEPWEC